MICDLERGGTYFNTTPVMNSVLKPRALCVGRARKPGYFFAGEGRADIQYCVFQYTLSGRGCFTANGKRHHLPPGTGFLCDINDPAYTYFYPEDATEPWKFVYLQMVGGNIHEWVAEIVQHYGYVYSLDMATPVLNQFETYLSGPNPINMTAAESARFVTELLCTLIQSKDTQQEGRSTTHVVRQAMRMISKQSSRILTAGELAERLHVSREHLSRIFRSQLRTTPYRFILDQKVQQACLDLRSTNRSIKEIATALGFRSPAHFTQVFVRSIGQPPSTYRNNGK